MKSVGEINAESNKTLNEIRKIIIEALGKAPDYHVDLDEEKVSNPTCVYYSDGDGNPYEGRVSAVRFEVDQLVIWTDDIDFPVEISESDFSYCFRSHDFLISILENICEVIGLDINQL